MVDYRLDSGHLLVKKIIYSLTSTSLAPQDQEVYYLHQSHLDKTLERLCINFKLTHNMNILSIYCHNLTCLSGS